MPWDIQAPKNQDNKAELTIPSVTHLNAGRYSCYSYTSDGWSEPSDTLELVVTGNFQKPIFWAEPSSVIESENSVTIWCKGTMETQIYLLYKEGSPGFWDRQNPKQPGNKAVFSITSMEKHNAGQYRCYCYNFGGWSQHSDTPELVMTGVYPSKVTLSAIPSPVVTSGSHVILQCDSQQAYNRFMLMREEEKLSRAAYIQNAYTRSFRAQFTLGPVTPNQRWRFTCYGYYLNSSQLWSVPSNKLELFISGGHHGKPTLSAFASPVVTSGLSRKPILLNQQGPALSPGDNLTLQCSSETSYVRFALSKEGRSDLPHLSTNQSQTGQYHANFTLGFVDFSIAGQYRCWCIQIFF